MAAPRPGQALVVAVEGVSGAGKTTVTRELARLLNGQVIEEAYDRLGRRVSLEVRSRTDLVEVEGALLAEEGERWAEVEDLRFGRRPVLLDTGTLGPLTYSWGLRESGRPEWDIIPDVLRTARALLAGGRWGIPDLTLYLDVPESLALGRAHGSPDRHDPELVERHREVGRYERILYHLEFPRRFPARFGSVTGEGGPRDVAYLLQERLERMAPLQPWTAPEEERLLDLFEDRAAAERERPTAHPNG